MLVVYSKIDSTAEFFKIISFTVAEKYVPIPAVFFNVNYVNPNYSLKNSTVDC